MPPHVQLVMGPAGVGKSTYCQALQEHAAAERRTLHVANLDPAAEGFSYKVAFDIRDLVSVADVMEEMELGPNGALVYCMEYLLEESEWLRDELENFNDDEYLILDCPGQVELYSHVPVMRTLVENLTGQHGIKCCGVYLIDATFAADPAKFVSGSLLSLSAMIQLELPHLNVLTKCDLVDEEELERVLDFESASMLLDSARDDRPAHDRVTKAARAFYRQKIDPMEPVAVETRTGGSGGGGSGGGGGEADEVKGEEAEEDDDNEDAAHGGVFPSPSLSSSQSQSWRGGGGGVKQRSGAGGAGGGAATAPHRLSKLTYAISELLDDFSMVAFIPLNLKDEESVSLVLRAAESLTQYGEDQETRMGDGRDDDEDE